MAPRLGVFGGSGFYEFLDDAVEHVVDTPYGPPAAPVVVGSIAGHEVAFMARHGVRHDYQPHRVPYRANVWAMHSIGVTSMIAPCSVGSLQPDIHPEQLVVVDQLVDRTWGRPDTFHDTDRDIHHQTFAEPYDAGLRAASLAAAAARRRRRPRRRDDGRDQRPALLDRRRVAVVPGDGMACRQHDGISRKRCSPPSSGCGTPPSRSSPTTTPASTGTNQ